MARTPLLETVQRAAADAAGEDRSTTRRGFLRDAAAAGAATTAFGMFAQRARAAVPAGRVVVVGAGLAGLSAAYRLKQAGINAEVHEASDRVGGRCWTLRRFFADGQIVERGGELIDQSHFAMRNLANQLGFKLDNLLQAEQNGTEQTSWFDGARYSYEEATADLKAAWQKIHKDVSAASYPTLFDLSTPRGRELDAMSIVDWINETFEGGINSKIGQLLDVAYNIEYGAESSEQSSLNLLYLLAYSGQGQLRVFGPSNEKYHVVGGNDQVTTKLGQLLAGQITMGSQLTAARGSSRSSRARRRRSSRRTASCSRSRSRSCARRSTSRALAGSA
jgi:monoamine oxidase